MNKMKIGFINLGCDKNRVDTEILINSLLYNYEITNKIEEAQIIIINTCGFIEISKQESINTILEMAKYKDKECKLLIATGCLTQRYKGDIKELIPEIDIIFGVNDYEKMGDAINNYFAKNEPSLYYSESDSSVYEGKRFLTTKNGTAYLKIAEGCNNNCTYCSIPSIRGKYRSRTMEHILSEAKYLAKENIKEIILIAQDTTRYGVDLYNKKMLPELLKELSKIDGIEWIRLLYCYPEEITPSLIEEIAINKKVCKYIDIPIQHISNNILKKMARKGTKEDIINVISKLKSRIPNISIRTSLIVGFPGEEDTDFEELVDFIKEVNFSKLGVFKYSKEEGTKAFNMTNQIDESIKEKRQNELMTIQQKISKGNNKNKIGEIYKVIIYDYDGTYYLGRSFEMSPDIDGIIYIKSEKTLAEGEFHNVLIEKALNYDLIGVIKDESCE